MKSILLVAVLAFAQVPPGPVTPPTISGQTSIPAYTLGVLTVQGGTFTTVTWIDLSGNLSTYNNGGNTFVYTASPGVYPVMAFVFNGSSMVAVLSPKVTVTGTTPPAPVPPTPTPPAPTPPAPTPTPTPVVTAVCPVAPPATQPPPATAEPLQRVSSTPVDPTQNFVITTDDPIINFQTYKNKAGWWQGSSPALETIIKAGRIELDAKGVKLDENMPIYLRRDQLIKAGTKVITGFRKPQNYQQLLQDHPAKKAHTLKARGLNKFTPDPTAPSFSWVNQKIVSAPHDQGQCGSCWIFSSAKVYSAAYALKYGVIQEPSEQNLLLCDHNNGNGGCNGGNQAFDYMISPGVACLSALAYTGNDRGSCPQVTPSLFAESWGYIPGSGDGNSIPTVAQIKQGLCEYGPLWVTMDASSMSFASYSGGVFVGRNSPYSGMFSGGSPDTDHAITLVGWDDANECWLVANSWSTSWGLGGFWYQKYNTSNFGYMASYVIPK
jgi:hypothetical protein